MARQQSNRDSYFGDRSEDVLALAGELIDYAQRLCGAATHMQAVAAGTATVSDLSVREARQLGRQAFAVLAAARKRRAAA